MYFIPYIVYKCPENSHYALNLFLENGGKSLIQINSFEAGENYLAENDFFLKAEMWQEEDTLYAPIDASKTRLDNFFSWTEFSYHDARECWRMFLTMPDYVDPATTPVVGNHIQTILSHIAKYRKEDAAQSHNA